MKLIKIIKAANIFYSLAAAPEFLKLREDLNKRKSNADLWFGPQIAKLNDDAKNFAIIDNKIKKAIKQLDSNYSIVGAGNKDEYKITAYYLSHPKTQDLIKFICNSYNKNFPHLNAEVVKENLINDGSLDPDSEEDDNPIFILIHDLIHQVIEHDFVNQLESQRGDDEDVVTLLDQLNEDLASSLSSFQPGVKRSSQGLAYYLKLLFLNNLKNNTKNYTANDLVDAINKTFHRAKAELRGKLDTISEQLSSSYKEKIKQTPPKVKQLVDGFLSKLKNEMMNKVTDVIDNKELIGYNKKYTDIWSAFELQDLFDEYNSNIMQSSIISQPDSSALRSWMIGCFNQMKQLLHYFEFELEEEIIGEYPEDEDE
jgi:hypothetical protein